MSLDIYLYDTEIPEDEDRAVASMNWLRNPFGLCSWAMDNVNIEAPNPIDLWYVINHWNYDKGASVDRKLFKAVIDMYWSKIRVLERGYFVFDLRSYRQFVEPHLAYFLTEDLFHGYTHIMDSKYNDNGELMIPQERFAASVFNFAGRHTFAHYKEWFGELVKFAELLQNPRYEFYCSN